MTHLNLRELANKVGKDTFSLANPHQARRFPRQKQFIVLEWFMLQLLSGTLYRSPIEQAHLVLVFYIARLAAAHRANHRKT